MSFYVHALSSVIGSGGNATMVPGAGRSEDACAPVSAVAAPGREPGTAFGEAGL